MSLPLGRPVVRRAAVRQRATLLVLGALALAGCGSDDTGGGGRVIGDTLTVVSLLPLSGPEAPVARDLLRGEKLALAEAGGRAGAYQVTLSALDEGGADPDSIRQDAAAGARLALSDSQAIAVIGSLRFESAAVTVPLLNSAGLLQVSPTVGYPGFVSPLSPGEPDRWYPSGRRSFAPAVADDVDQATTLVAAIRAASGVARPRIVVEREAGPEDVAFADAVADAARAQSARVVGEPRRADAVVYAGDDPVSAAAIAEDVTREAPDALLAFGDDLARTGLEQRLAPSAARRAVFVSRAPEPASTPALRAFETEYARRFGSAPGPYAVLGYATMRSLLRDGIAAAGAQASERGRLIQTYLASARSAPALSAYRLRGERRVYVDGTDRPPR